MSEPISRTIASPPTLLERLERLYRDERQAYLRHLPLWDLFAEAEYRLRESDEVLRQAESVDHANGTESLSFWLAYDFNLRELKELHTELRRRLALEGELGRLHAPGRVTAAFAQALKPQVVLSDYLTAHDFTLRRAGPGHFTMLCPIHQEKTPSLHVWDKPEGGHYHCFGCHIDGDVYDWIGHDGTPWAEAVTRIATYLGIALPEPPPPGAPPSAAVTVYEP